VQDNIFSCDENLQNSHLTFKSINSIGRHAWIRLTPAYSVSLVEEIIDCYPRPKWVLDPFNGSGTTTLVCAINGIKSTGVEINPFLVWLSKAKAAKYSESEIQIFKKSAKEVIERSKRISGNYWQPEIYKIDRWWNKLDLDFLSHLFATIQVHNAPQKVIDLLRITFCRTMMRVSNASFGHQSMSFKKNQVKRRPDVITVFRENVKFIAESINTIAISGIPEVIKGDSRELATVLPHNSFDLIITSPPYPNRISYIRELRPYMYWLGYLRNGRQAGEMDWDSIGGTWGIATSNLIRWKPLTKTTLPELKPLLRKISKDSEILSKYVEKYFYDMDLHVRQLFDVVAKGGKIHYVVGNSKFYDILLPTENLFESLFKKAGFENTRIERIRKRSSKRELYEFLVYAQKH